jgi:hypothetical protein
VTLLIQDESPPTRPTKHTVVILLLFLRQSLLHLEVVFVFLLFVWTFQGNSRQRCLRRAFKTLLNGLKTLLKSKHVKTLLNGPQKMCWRAVETAATSLEVPSKKLTVSSLSAVVSWLGLQRRGRGNLVATLPGDMARLIAQSLWRARCDPQLWGVTVVKRKAAPVARAKKGQAVDNAPRPRQSGRKK